MLRRRVAFHSGWLSAMLAALALASAPDGDAHPARRVEFDRDVRPILMDKCFACHGPDASKRKAELYLDRSDEIFKECDEGRRIVAPGDVEKSELFRRVTADDPDERMPPPQSGKLLSPEQVETLRLWIAEGAPWKDHWAFQKPVRPAPPAVRDAEWCANAIDRFVLARLESEGLAPSPAAEREALIRRASFDLTGLPPTLAEIDAFVADRSPDAYAKVVDRLLASPAYGERMASLWLDLAAYADTNGYHIDNHRDMWKWREWVIDAFNANEPFDRFTIEQLAGDMLPDATLAQKVASGFNRNHPINFEGGADPDEYQTKYVVDRVKTTSTVWMGLTMGCAECHNHKYDPITQREFYSFYALFNNVPEKGLDGAQSLPVPNIRVPAPDQARRLAAFDASVGALQARLAAPDADMDAAQVAWEAETLASLPPPVVWNVLAPTAASSRNGATLTQLADGSLLASGANPARETYEIVAAPGAGPLAALRLEALLDPSLPEGAAGRADNGNFVLTGVEGELVTLAHPEIAEPLAFAAAEADFSQADGDFGIANAIDADPQTGWAGAQHQRRSPRTAVFVLARPLDVPADGVLRVRLRFESAFAKHAIGRLRLAATPDSERFADRLPPKLSTWSRVGPFTAASGKLADESVFPPEQELRSETPYAASYLDGKLAWKEEPGWKDGAVQMLPGDENAAWFLARTIETDSPRRFVLHLGSDDTLKVWLDGALVHSHLEPRAPAPDQDKVEVELHAGANRLLLKVVNYSGGAGFAFRIEPAGRGGLAPELAAILRLDAAQRSAEQRAALREHYRRDVSDPGRALVAELAADEALRKALLESIPQTMVMEELPERRETNVLVRGDFRAKGERVEPGVPACVPSSGAIADRLDLARWLVSGENPLTARVTVNRLWQMLFDNGLVKTSEDFGARSELPSHPELLDWLAVELVERGWDVKALLRELVLSSTYRQVARTTPALLERDPDNRLLARGPRQRLTSEMVRDNALAVSDLLVRTIGGPSVRPYQPKGLWEAVSFSAEFTSQSYVQDHDDALWRRGLYVYWKRALPYPSMATFDSPIHETSTCKRAETNTPLQALVLLNDPVYVEAARNLGQRILEEGGASDEERIVFAFRLCTSRRPTVPEIAVLQRIHVVQREEYAADPAAAAELLSVGESPRRLCLDQAELAAWTAVGNVLLNLDETLHRG
jgi:hypothetical protein